MDCTCEPDAWIPCESCCKGATEVFDLILASDYRARLNLSRAMRMQLQDAKPESKGSGPEGSSPLGGHSG